MLKNTEAQFSNFLVDKNLPFKKHITTFLLVISIIYCIFYTNNLSAQEKNISLTETLRYLNTKLEGNYSFDVKNGELFLKCFKDGKVYREDKAYLNDIDPFSVTYVKDENSVVFKCLENSLNCIIRSFKQGTGSSKNSFKRSPITVEGMDEKSINGIQSAIIHMIRLVQNSKYVNSQPFEERSLQDQ
ncbi:MAG: hypothetical protein J0M08_12765 [Bacteroidetes bacterium]|nr:hypothetical protein [Bacteroidota bacterium]